MKLHDKSLRYARSARDTKCDGHFWVQFKALARQRNWRHEHRVLRVSSHCVSSAICGGVSVRVLGLLLILLAGPVVLSNERHGDGQLRFAYADNSAFRASYEVRATAPAREPMVSSDIQDQPPAPLPLTLAAPDHLSTPSWATARSRRSLCVPAIRSGPDVMGCRRLRQPSRRHCEPRRWTRICTLPQPPQRLAALEEPTHLLASVPPLEEIAAETKPVVPHVETGPLTNGNLTHVRNPTDASARLQSGRIKSRDGLRRCSTPFGRTVRSRTNNQENIHGRGATSARG